MTAQNTNLVSGTPARTDASETRAVKLFGQHPGDSDLRHAVDGAQQRLLAGGDSAAAAR